MRSFLETYGVAIFTLVLMAILIAFASPFGIRIKQYICDNVNTTTEISSKEIDNRDKVPVSDQVYAMLYTDGELVLSSDPITAEKTVATDYHGSTWESVVDGYPAWKGNTSVTSVRIIGTLRPSHGTHLFADLTNLTTIKNIENLDTSACTSLLGMFENCQNLTSIDLTHFNTSNVTNMARMFSNCYKIKTLNFSTFDTSKVTDMRSMFAQCHSITLLSLTTFDTSNVTSMISMFDGCINLLGVNMSTFNTNNVESFDGMFAYCYTILSIDFSNFHISNTATVSNMFIQVNQNVKITSSKDIKTKLYTDSTYATTQIAESNWTVK